MIRAFFGAFFSPRLIASASFFVTRTSHFVPPSPVQRTRIGRHFPVRNRRRRFGLRARGFGLGLAVEPGFAAGRTACPGPAVAGGRAAPSRWQLPGRSTTDDPRIGVSSSSTIVIVISSVRVQPVNSL